MSNSKSQRKPVQAIIVAAGSGERMQGKDKVFSLILGKPAIIYSVETLLGCEEVSNAILVLHPDKLDLGHQLLKDYSWGKFVKIVPGGERRQDSVSHGLRELTNATTVVIHDGARPCLTADLIKKGLKEVNGTGAAVAAIPINDTIKKTTIGDIVTETLDRSQLWSIQTPQVFFTDILLAAHRQVKEDVTDDATMVELTGKKVKLFMGSPSNIKITHEADLIIAKEFLKGRSLL